MGVVRTTMAWKITPGLWSTRQPHLNVLCLQDVVLTLSLSSSDSHSHVENGAHPQALLHEDTEVLLGTHCNILWVAQDKGGALKRKTSFRCSRTEELEFRRKYYEDEFSTRGLEHKWGRQADWLRRSLILPSLLLSPWKGWVLSPSSLFINIRLSHLNVIC